MNKVKLKEDNDSKQIVWSHYLSRFGKERTIVFLLLKRETDESQLFSWSHKRIVETLTKKDRNYHEISTSLQEIVFGTWIVFCIMLPPSLNNNTDENLFLLSQWID
jgi:hypothetical protein